MSTAGASEKVSAFFVELKYGDPAAPTFLRLTDWSADLTFQSLTYTSQPEMKIENLEISGIFDDRTVELTLPLVAGGFTDRVANGAKHSPVYVTIWEKLFSTSGGSDQVLTLFSGKINRVIRNFQGRPNFVMLEFKSTKQRLDVPMGLVATHQCQWSFGGRGCGVTVTTSTGTMTAFSGKTATITGLSGQADRFWHRGFVEKDGIRIEIRDWVNGTSFELMQEPPPEWAGASVKVYAGCDKSIETCRARWNNEANFSGFGYAIPNYSPNYEIVD